MHAHRLASLDTGHLGSIGGSMRAMDGWMDACDDERIGTHLCRVQRSFKTIVTYSPLNPHLTAIRHATLVMKTTAAFLHPTRRSITLRLGLSHATATSSARPTFYLSRPSDRPLPFSVRPKPTCNSTYLGIQSRRCLPVCRPATRSYRRNPPASIYSSAGFSLDRRLFVAVV